MGVSRRNVLIGLGGIVAAGGALVGTGAFTTVQAERSVNVQTAGDSDAFLALAPSDGPNGAYATTSNNTVEIILNGNADTEGGTGINQDAKTVIRNIIKVTNNGTQDVTSLTLEMADSDGNIVSDDQSDPISFTSDADPSQDFLSGEDILAGNGLSTGNSVQFGLTVDLIDNTLDDNNYDLTITANTSNSQ